MNRAWKTLWAASLVVTAAGCPGLSRPVVPPPPPPVVFQQPPNLEQLLAAVNANSDRVYDLQTDSAWLSVTGYPKLRANLRLERPQRMRLKASVVGRPVLDMGSNDERFWVWGGTAPVFHARHDQFATTSASQLIPVEPTWLIEALGLIHFEPAGAHSGPYQREDGSIEVHTRLATARGELVRVVGVDPQYGYVTEVSIRDPAGRLLAAARASEHRHDPAAQVTLPGRVEVELFGSRLPVSKFTFETDGYVVNMLRNAPNPGLWAMPPGQSQDLADPSLQLPAEFAPPAGRGPTGPGPNGQLTGQGPRPPGAVADTAYYPEFRGFTR